MHLLYNIICFNAILVLIQLIIASQHFIFKVILVFFLESQTILIYRKFHPSLSFLTQILNLIWYKISLFEMFGYKIQTATKLQRIIFQIKSQWFDPLNASLQIQLYKKFEFQSFYLQTFWRQIYYNIIQNINKYLISSLRIAKFFKIDIFQFINNLFIFDIILIIFIMGNVLLDNTLRKKQDPLKSFQTWIEENSQLMNKKVHMQNKVFRTTSFTYRSSSQNILSKAYLKRDMFNLEQYKKGFDIIKTVIDPNSYHNMLPFIQLKNFDQPKQQFVVVLRQYIAMTLEERLVMQPPLTIQQKYWIIFQMLICVYGLHVQGNLYHGHIRTSNFLLQTNNHVILTDFATYKPLYLIQDDLAEFRLYYGSSGNKCTVAPEKLISQLQKDRFNRNPTLLLSKHCKQKGIRQTQNSSYFKMSYNQDILMQKSNLQTQTMNSQKTPINEYINQVNCLKQMDIFSLGCCIAQILQQGKPIMTYQNLLQFKKGEYTFQTMINSITQNIPNGQKIRVLLQNMLSKQPLKRPSILQVLRQWLQITGQQVYILIWYLYNLFSKASFFSSDIRIGLIRKILQKIQSEQQPSNRFKFVQNLPIALQKIDFLRSFITPMQRNISPNLMQIKLTANTIIQKIQNDLQRSDSQLNKAVQENGSDFDFKSQKNQKDKQEKITFTSMENLKIKKFKIYETKKKVIESRKLCPPKWCPELEAQQNTKFKGSKLSQQQIQYNLKQQFLEKIKNSQHQIQKFIKKPKYQKYQELIKIIFSCIRNTKYVSSRLVAIQLLYCIGCGSKDKIKIQKIMTYLFSFTLDYDFQIASYSLRKIIDLFYTIVQPFSSIEQTKYYKIIIQNFTTISKSNLLRSVFFEKLSQILKIVEWLSIHCIRFNKNQKSNQNQIIDSVIKQYGTYTNCEKIILMQNVSEFWTPRILTYFITMLNDQKVLGFRQGVKIALKQEIVKQLDLLDMCLQTGLEQCGIAAFFAIRYFKIRKITQQQIVAKIIPLVVYPNIWIREQVVQYINMCLDHYPATKIYFLFNKILQVPFPLEKSNKSDMSLLPRMLTSKQFDLKQKKVNYTGPENITIELFKRYLQKIKSVRQFPQIDDDHIKKWNNLSKGFMEQSQQKKIGNLLGDYSVELLTQLYKTNLLYYLRLLKKKYEESKQKDGKQQYQQLQELCEKTYQFNLKGGIITYEQKIMFNHIQTYLMSNSESFLKMYFLSSSWAKKLFSDNLILTSSLLNKFQSFQVLPTISFGKYFKEPTQPSKMSKPMGTLICQFHQHKDTISCIQKVADRFFITGSYDGTIRIFDSKKIQQDIISDSIGVLDIKSEFQGGNTSIRVSSMATLQDTMSLVTGTTKGVISIYRFDYFGKNNQFKKSLKINNNSIANVQKYNVKGQIQKIITLKNDLRNHCFSFITSQGYIGIQDIRTNKQCLKCSLGKQRGLPKSLLQLYGSSTILAGTINGYLLTYDIRCNLLSNVYQLASQTQSLPILSMNNVPLDINQVDQLISITYPSKNYEFCYFNINNVTTEQLRPQQIFTSCSQQECIITPYLKNKTKEEGFKNCNNSLSERNYYKFIPQFYQSIDIISYLRDPLTMKQNIIKQLWLSNSKQRYAQITSISNKRYLPFIQYLSGGILTHFNPNPNKSKYNKGNNLSLLTTNEKVKKQSSRIPTSTIEKEIKKINRYNFLPEEQGVDYYTCCKVLPNFVVVGSRDSIVKVYK